MLNRILLILLILSMACNTSKKAGREIPSFAMAPLIIYKTSKDYREKVPVSLDESRQKILNYPGRNDIYTDGRLAYPTPLKKGYLLDNRGINGNVAFLDYTYEEYSKLEKTPSATELMGHILDNDPLVEMYHCGSRYDYKNINDEINSKIAKGDFGSFKKLK